MFAVGDYKRIPNEVADRKTAMPENAPHEIARLLDSYDPKASHTLEQIVDFHVRLERIHPFQDSNGRVGRLVMLKECLSSDIVPFVISDEMKPFQYRGLSEWDTERGFSSMRVCMPKIASSNGWNTSASPTTNRDALHCSRVPSCKLSASLYRLNVLSPCVMHEAKRNSCRGRHFRRRRFRRLLRVCRLHRLLWLLYYLFPVFIDVISVRSLAIRKHGP